MPLYDYKCEPCHMAFEALVSMGERDRMECPVCDKIATRQVSKPSPMPSSKDRPGRGRSE